MTDATARAQTEDAVEVEAALADEVAYLFQQHHQAIFAYLFRLLNHRETAHDLTQETFIRVLQHRHALGEIKNKRAWIYRIATNLARNAHRRQSFLRWLPWRNAGDGRYAQTWESYLVEEQLDVERALAALSPIYRSPLLLYVRDGFDISEIADILGISEGAVRTRISRARKKLRYLYHSGETAR